MTARPLVVQVVPYFPPHLGGVEMAAQAIAQGLAKTRPVEVLTSTVGARGWPRVERDGQLTVRRLRSVEVANTPVAPALAIALLRLPGDVVVHVHVTQAFTPEVVWATARLRRRAFVAHFHLDVGPSGASGRLLALYKRTVLARVLRAASAVIVLSAEQARFVIGRYRVRPERVTVVPNGVPANLARAGPAGLKARPVTAVPECGPAGSLALLFVGRLSIQKNLPRLLEAVSLMRHPAKLALVGDGPEQAALTRLAERLGLDVTFAGRREHAELAAWYRWADVFVLSSDNEGMPLAVLEAMSFGLPVVATDVPGLRELCAADGLLVPPDAAALAAALDTLAADPAARGKLAARSAARAADADWTRSLEQLEELYLGVGR